MDMLRLQPGLVVYYGGNGLGVVVGKKEMTLPGLSEPMTAYEVRTIRNVTVPISIPLARLSSVALRIPSTKEELMEPLEILTQKGRHLKSTVTPYAEKEASRILASVSPREIAVGIRSLVDSYSEAAKNFFGIPAIERKFVFKGIELLADDLSMAAGLSFNAARDHVTTLITSDKKLEIWPAQAQEQKADILDEALFEKAFGINFEQADNLALYSPKVAPASDNKKAKNESQISLMMALEQNAATRISDQVKKFLSERPFWQKDFQDIIGLAPHHGSSRAAIEFSLLHLNQKQFQLLSMSYLVKAEHRVSIDQLAIESGLSDDEAKYELATAVKKFSSAATSRKKHDFVSLIEKIASNMGRDKKETPTSVSSNGLQKKADEPVMDERHQKMLSLIHDRGPTRGSFMLIKDSMDHRDLDAFSMILLCKTQYRENIKSYAEKSGIDEEDLRQILRNGLIVLAEKAVAAGRGSYLNKEMCELCPEIANFSVPRKYKPQDHGMDAPVRAKARPSEAKDPADKKGYIKPELIQQAKIEDSLVAPTGMMRKVYAIACKTLTPEQFSIYVASDLRMPHKRQTLEQIAEEDGLNLDAIKRIRNSAIVSIKESLGDSERKQNYQCLQLSPMQDSVFEDTQSYSSVHPQQAEKRNGHYPHLSDAAEVMAPQNFDATDEADIIERMRCEGFNEHSLKDLAKIYERDGKLDTSLRLYGAALDLAEGDLDHDALKKLHELQNRLGYDYDTARHFSELEMYLQERMNNRINNENAYTPGFIDPVEAEPSRSRTETVFTDHDVPPVPHVTYAIPAEALKPGQRLKMTFMNTGAGALEVTMEVELTGPETKAPDIEDPRLTKGYGTNGHSLHSAADRDDLNVVFERHSNGSASVSVGPTREDVQSRGNGVAFDPKPSSFR